VSVFPFIEAEKVEQRNVAKTSTLLELIDRRSWATRTHVRRAVFDYIEAFFNRRRLHSSLS
jgi:transposase InsO family protein